jgi:hypothetical protein
MQAMERPLKENVNPPEDCSTYGDTEYEVSGKLISGNNFALS